MDTPVPNSSARRDFGLASESLTIADESPKNSPHCCLSFGACEFTPPRASPVYGVFSSAVNETLCNFGGL
jgi:hypothetical protein